MKKITSVLLMLLIFLSNLFCYSFADDNLVISESLDILEEKTPEGSVHIPLDEESEIESIQVGNLDTKDENIQELFE